MCVESNTLLVFEVIANLSFIVLVQVLPCGCLPCELLNGLLLIKGQPVGFAQVRVVRAQGCVVLAAIGVPCARSRAIPLTTGLNSLSGVRAHETVLG